jgi:hypothetical protein
MSKIPVAYTKRIPGLAEFDIDEIKKELSDEQQSIFDLLDLQEATEENEGDICLKVNIGKIEIWATYTCVDDYEWEHTNGEFDNIDSLIFFFDY